MRPASLAALAALAALVSGARAASPPGPSPSAVALDAPDAWRTSGRGAIRGITIGPIENALHPGVGYGSPAYGRTLDESRRGGATWVSLTVFGRVNDLTGRGVDPTFEAPHAENRDAVRRAVRMAHARGLSVFLVPHLWIESGDWRARIDPVTDQGWAAWARSYEAYVTGWAQLAEETGVDMLAAGVELRSWVTTPRAPSFAAMLGRLRRVYHGLLTYSANWDDAADTVVLGALDVIGVNAFYPLAERAGASPDELRAGGLRVRDDVRRLAAAWQKPVVFTEIGYTARPDPAYHPWEWPDAMRDVRVDEDAQAEAYRALVAPLLDEPSFAGFFVWRIYADPDDVSQERDWGFSPRGKRAERVVLDAFAAPWAADAWPPGAGWGVRPVLLPYR